MKFWQRLLIASILTLLALGIGGCYSRREIEEIAFVAAWGLEEGTEQKFKITVQVPAPSKVAGAGGSEGGGGGGDEPYWLGISEGESIFEAIRELAKRSSRNLDFAHAQALIIHEDLAKDGIESVIDALTRNQEMRPDTLVLITSENIEEIFKITSPLEILASVYIERLVMKRYQDELADIYQISDFNSRMIAGNEATIPRVSTWQNPEDMKKADKSQGDSEEMAVPTAAEGESQSGGSEGGQEQKPPQELIIQGGAVFRGSKMVDWLSGPEVRALKFLRGDILNGPLVGQVPGCRFSLSVRESYRKVQIKPNLPDLGSSEVRLLLTIETDLLEVENPGLEIDNMQLKRIGTAVEDKLHSQIQDLIRKVKFELSSDVFGFGELIRREVPFQVWENSKANWNDQFRNLIIDTQVEVIVRRVGMTTQSPSLH